MSRLLGWVGGALTLLTLAAPSVQAHWFFHHKQHAYAYPVHGTTAVFPATSAFVPATTAVSAFHVPATTALVPVTTAFHVPVTTAFHVPVTTATTAVTYVPATAAATPATAASSTQGVLDFLTIIERALPLVERLGALRPGPAPDTGLGARVSRLETRYDSLDARVRAIEVRLQLKPKPGDGDNGRAALPPDEPSGPFPTTRAAAAAAVARSTSSVEKHLDWMEGHYYVLLRSLERNPPVGPKEKAEAKDYLDKLAAWLTAHGRKPK
jgi:hypothetical protein